ncbi:hypothetical protein ACW4YW_14985 [Methylobacillus pratensis]
MDRHNPPMLKVRQGETYGFRASFQNDDHSPMDITGFEIRCQLRTLRQVLVHDFEVEVIDAVRGVVAFLPTDTAAWPVENGLVMDFKISLGGQVKYTDRIQVNLIETVTT